MKHPRRTVGGVAIERDAVAHFFEIDLKEMDAWRDGRQMPSWVSGGIVEIEALLASWAEFDRLFPLSD